MAVSDFTIIRRSMTSRLFSTVTTAITVAVAVALMLLLLGMRDAGRQAFARGSGNMHLLVSRDASPMVAVLNSVFYANAPADYIDWRRYEALSQEYPLAWAIPTQLGDTYRGNPVMATTSQFFTDFQPHDGEPWRLAAGRFFEDSFEMVIGARAAAVTGLSVGDRIYVAHGASSADQETPAPPPVDDHDHDHDHDHAHDDHEHEHEGGGHFHTEY
ncbi:MAG: ABC transporter permease, partial [Planctomycetota bacterium]|nr:ABC transporter permease [Planctomycetota bacterium]